MAKKSSTSNFIWGGTHPMFYHPFVSAKTPDLTGKVILDIGCGKGLNGFLIHVTRDLTNATIIGLDANAYYLDFCKQHRLYDKYIQAKLPNLPFADKSIDFVLCSEVIEHLKKPAGQKLLNEIDRVCRGQALVTTPNIFFQTTPGTYEDAHHSLWNTTDFQQRGYKVYGIGAKTTLLHGDPLLAIKQALYFLLSPFSYLIPQIGGYLMATKSYLTAQTESES